MKTETVNPADFRFLYRDPSDFYLASDEIALRGEMVSKKDGDQYLKDTGRDLDTIGYGFVVMPTFDLASSAYERLLNLSDFEFQDAIYIETNGINATIAMALGYRIQSSTNYPHTTVTKNKFASPYRDGNQFSMMPNYLKDLEAALEVAPDDCDLSLTQNGAVWTATYKNRHTGREAKHSGDQIHSILLSALAMRPVTLST
jgi:hypothetical protein